MAPNISTCKVDFAHEDDMTDRDMTFSASHVDTLYENPFLAAPPAHGQLTSDKQGRQCRRVAFQEETEIREIMDVSSTDDNSSSNDNDGASEVKNNDGLSDWAAMGILINFISMGYILNPSGFAQGGTILGAICLVLVSLQSRITGVFILEACARAEMLNVATTRSPFFTSRGNMLASGQSILETAGQSFFTRPNRNLLATSASSPAVDETSASTDSDCEAPTNNPVVERDSADATSKNATDSDLEVATNPINKTNNRKKKSNVPKRYLPPQFSIRVHQRTYELSELCRTFMGRWLRNFFTLSTAGDLYGISWTLAAVFGSSLSENLPMGTDYDYHIYILLFIAITVPMSCMKIAGQVSFQMFFLMARTVMLLLMLGTLAAAYITKTSHFGTQLHAANETPVANFSAIVTVLQLCVFSTSYQCAVPGLTGETRDKSGIVKVITRSVYYVFATNLVCALMVAIYFGAATEGSANLNWLYYHGGTWNGEGEFTRSWWATGISSYIVLFAALDGIAVYPLLAVSLGEILMGAMFEEKVHEMESNWKVRMAFRLLASIPQAVGSMFMRDLGVIAKVAGIFTLLSYTVCPSYLAIRSKMAVKEAGLPTKTFYSPFFSSDLTAYIMIGFATVLIVGVFLDALGFLSVVLGGGDATKSSGTDATGWDDDFYTDAATENLPDSELFN